MTLPLISFGTAAAGAAGIVHFTDGPLPRNRLIAFTALVGLAAIALVALAWRAGAALVEWYRARKSAQDALNVVSRASVSAETQTPATTPVGQRSVGTAITPDGLLPSARDFLIVFEATKKKYGVDLNFAPRDFIKSNDPLAFNHQANEAIVMGEIEGEQQKIHVFGQSTGTWTLPKAINEDSLRNQFRNAILGLAPKEANVLTFFIPNFICDGKWTLSAMRKPVNFALNLLRDKDIFNAFSVRRIFLEQPTS